MDTNRLKALAIWLHNQFSKAQPNETKLEHYYQELFGIAANDDAVNAIKQHFRGLSEWPKQVTEEIKRAYWAYEAAHKKRLPYPLHRCETCNSTGYLCSLEVIPKPEWRIKSVEPKPRPVTWTCPHCRNWETGPWEREDRCDPPDHETLMRCIPHNENFSAEYEEIINEMFAGILQGKDVTHAQ